jgi:hypothetical protein
MAPLFRLCITRGGVANVFCRPGRAITMVAADSNYELQQFIEFPFLKGTKQSGFYVLIYCENFYGREIFLITSCQKMLDISVFVSHPLSECC